MDATKRKLKETERGRGSSFFCSDRLGKLKDTNLLLFDFQTQPFVHPLAQNGVISFFAEPLSFLQMDRFRDIPTAPVVVF